VTANVTRRIGFVSTRLAGNDGVSLEARKWSEVLTGLGHQCFCFAGESDWPAELSHVVPEAHFQHPDVQRLNASLFQATTRSPATSRSIQGIKQHLKTRLRHFVGSFDLDLLIVENALAIPMHVPLGLALTEFIGEVSMPTIAHHHDFAWERARFWPNAAADYLGSAFPPILPSIRHVVINSIAAKQLALRTGASSRLIPNVMDFHSPPPERDDLVSHGLQGRANLRSALSIDPEEAFLLQPTRIVPRKGIERSIELAHRLECPCTLVISHASGDEGTAYEEYLRSWADTIGVRILFAAAHVARRRERALDGRRGHARVENYLGDIYRDADLVTYPSIIEGFGNAFLEAIYYRRPIVINRYDVFRSDIEPKGFEVVAFDGFIEEDMVERVRSLLDDPTAQTAMVDHNYRLGGRYYSYRTLERQLVAVLDDSLSA
jgi:glycosyltransferase involved in cell wall biosynthesis